MTLAPRLRPAAYGVIHALVDAACAVAVVRVSHGSTVGDLGAFGTVAGYDLLAFGLQFPLGLLADRLRLARPCMIVGAALTALILAPISLSGLTTMMVAGAGNALFHLGAGGLVLRSAGGRAAPAGVFVAPGALGLGLGLWMGRTGRGSSFPIYVALAFAVVALITLDKPGTAAPTLAAPTQARRPLLPWLVLLALLLVSVKIRSFVGFGACYQCPSGLALAIGLPIAAFLGTLQGGMVADRTGWQRASVVALLLSFPPIAFSGGSLLLALPGIVLFQSTMAVTVAAVYALMPAWPSTAFGLPSLALVLGSLPTFYPAGKQLFGPWMFALLIVSSTAALAVALYKLGDAKPVAREQAQAEAGAVGAQ